MTENDTLDGQIASRQRVPSTLAVFAKVLIIFLAGDLSEFLFHQHPAAAYAAGCAIGALLQALDWVRAAAASGSLACNES